MILKEEHNIHLEPKSCIKLTPCDIACGNMICCYGLKKRSTTISEFIMKFNNVKDVDGGMVNYSLVSLIGKN